MSEHWAVRPGFTEAVFIRQLFGDSYRLLFYPEGTVGFEHRCLTGLGDPVIVAPTLSAHTVTITDVDSRYPTVDVTPSISCPGCGLHGFVTNGYWRNA